MYQTRPPKGIYVARTTSTVSSPRNDIAIMSRPISTEEEARRLLPQMRQLSSKTAQRADWFVIQVLG